MKNTYSSRVSIGCGGAILKTFVSIRGGNRDMMFWRSQGVMTVVMLAVIWLVAGLILGVHEIIQRGDRDDYTPLQPL